MKGCPARKEGWSPERYARFEKAWKDGVEIELMGERFGITASAISSIAKRRGLPMKNVRTRPRPRNFIAPALALLLASFNVWAAPPPGSIPILNSVRGSAASKTRKGNFAVASRTAVDLIRGDSRPVGIKCK
jgi:hypothetical protein